MSLQVHILGTAFQNPVLLAAGTCGFGREVADVIDLEALGGLVTKSVTLEPRKGNAAPRVAELPSGMLNSVGLANPGAEAVRREMLPWLHANVRRAHALISLAGHTPDDYERLVAWFDGEDGFLGYELNLSCPNDTERGGPPFALDPRAVAEVVGRCRAATPRPLVVKLAPNDTDLPVTVRAAVEAGADALTLVNTLPGLDLDPRSGRPTLGAGPGGVSGPALRATGVRAVAEAHAVTDLPLLGAGGVLTTGDALQYLRAGASLIQVGTASFARPRAAEKIARELQAVLRAAGVGADGAASPGSLDRAVLVEGGARRGVDEAGPGHPGEAATSISRGNA